MVQPMRPHHFLFLSRAGYVVAVFARPRNMSALASATHRVERIVFAGPIAFGLHSLWFCIFARHASIVPHTSLCLGYLRRMDDRQLFVEALEAQIRDWGKVAKVCEQKVFSVELTPEARHSAQKGAKKYRGHIAELTRLIEFLKRSEVWKNPKAELRTQTLSDITARLSVETDPKELDNLIEQLTRIVEAQLRKRSLN
jgi:hypothetical protein